MYAAHYSRRARDEIRKLDQTIGIPILEAINEKLLVAPTAFGKPLRHSLRLLRTLRMGDWMIVYRLEEMVVHIITVRNRKKGYGNLT